MKFVFWSLLSMFSLCAWTATAEDKAVKTSKTKLASAPADTPVDSTDRTQKISKDSKVDVEQVDLFQAIEAGQIEVKFVPKDAAQATVIIRNKGDKPLDVQLPPAFGAVHVLPQMGMGMGGMGGGMGGMGGGGMGGMGGGMGGMGGGMGGGQGMGGGFGGGMGGMGGGMGGMGGGMGGMGGGMGGMGGGMFRVGADKSAKLKVQTVCLEHGKTDPNPRMEYRLVPIGEVNQDPRISKLCEILANGQIPQNTAQAAAWHMANGLSWDELAVKNRIESQFTGNVRWFNVAELQTAFQLTNVINRAYEESESTSASTSTSTSTSAE